MLLAIETSCDECSAAVVSRGSDALSVKVHSNEIYSQIDLHKAYGGVVPEVASRNHLEMINLVIEQALTAANTSLKNIQAIAVTSHPGLIGALLVGVSSAKALAYGLGLPLIAVNHLHGHIHSIFLENRHNHAILSQKPLPLLVCLVSGGHTMLALVDELPAKKITLLGQSLDDAAGEAFDKSAKLLGLPYPGGLHLDRLAQQGNASRFSFPRPMLHSRDHQFSFSGLKTAVLTELLRQGFQPHGKGATWGRAPAKDTLPQGALLNDFCASIQTAIVDTLIEKIKFALETTQAKAVAIVGGVSANSLFRAKLSETLNQTQTPLLKVDHQYCTDNAAMIGASGLTQWERNDFLTEESLLRLNPKSQFNI